MITLLGLACVAWTTYELIRLLQAESRPELSPRRPGAPQRRRFAAWDDQGRPIRVEDLGPR